MQNNYPEAERKISTIFSSKNEQKIDEKISSRSSLMKKEQKETRKSKTIKDDEISNLIDSISTIKNSKELCEAFTTILNLSVEFDFEKMHKNAFNNFVSNILLNVF